MITRLLLHREQKTSDKYMLSGIYKLTCPVCSKAYVGQIWRNFQIRFNEHRHAFKTNSHTSKFAQHLTEHNHPFGNIQTLCRSESFYNPFATGDRCSNLHKNHRFFTNSVLFNSTENGADQHSSPMHTP